MRVAIVGGSGLVGRALARSLATDGHDVVVLSRRPERARGRLPNSVSVAAWSGTDAGVDDLARTLDGVDVVVSLAGAPVGPLPWTARRKALIASSRVGVAGAIVDALATLPPDRRPRRLVVVSGVDAYAETAAGPDPAPWTEASPMGDAFLARVSRDLEAEARRGEPLGVSVVRMRMGHVLAADADLVRILALPVRLGLGGRIGSGEQWWSWIHIDDAVGLFRLAMADGGPDGVFNVVAPGACRQVTFVRAMARVLHRPSRVPVPAWLVRLVLREQSALLLGSRRATPARALELGYEFRFESIEAAMDDVLR